MFDFGLRLKQLREYKNFSQDDLSKKINKSKSVISGYENNIRTPPIDVLVNLSLLYNVSLDYLTGIDKSEMISIDGLSKRQRDLIYTILEELKSTKTSNHSGLSKRQQDILNTLMIEFSCK